MLSVPVPYVSTPYAAPARGLGRHYRGHPVHVSRVQGCPHMCPRAWPHAPSFGRQLLRAAHPCGMSLIARGIAPAVYGNAQNPFVSPTTLLQGLGRLGDSSCLAADCWFLFAAFYSHTGRGKTGGLGGGAVPIRHPHPHPHRRPHAPFGTTISPSSPFTPPPPPHVPT